MPMTEVRLCWGRHKLLGPSSRRGGPDERVGMIELDLPTGTRLRVDAFVNERALRRVLQALKGVA